MSKRWRQILKTEKAILEAGTEEFGDLSEEEQNSENDVENECGLETLSGTDLISESDRESSTTSLSNESLSSDEDGIGNFPSELANWACKNEIKRTALNQLLQLLRNNGHSDLPIDSRTLLQTPQTVNTIARCGGDYVYLGIEKGIRQKLTESKLVLNKISLIVNVDGIPLFKSSNVQLWPILAAIQGSQPFLVSCFCGTSKPSNNIEFMMDFIAEYSQLEINGIEFDGKKIPIKIKAFLCDAPARQFLKGIKSHNGYYGCERCQIKGESVDHRMIFEDTECEPRLDDAFRRYEYEEHQTSENPFSDGSILCIRDFALDYMHLICLGVVRRMLLHLKNGPRICKLSSRQIGQISDNLQQLNGTMPDEMARQPRRLDELKRWKATELRQFLLYTGPIVLKPVLEKKIYQHFLVLCVAMRIFLDANDDYREHNLQYASNLMKYFVQQSSTMYGPEGEFQRKVLLGMSEIINLLRTNKRAASTSHDDYVEKCLSEEEFETLEKTVKEDKAEFKNLVEKVSNIGGSSERECAKNILLTLTTDQVLSFYSGKGLKGKKAFEKMKLFDVVTSGVMAVIKDSSREKVRKEIADVLKHAPARVKQTKKSAEE